MVKKYDLSTLEIRVLCAVVYIERQQIRNLVRVHQHYSQLFGKTQSKWLPGLVGDLFEGLAGQLLRSTTDKVRNWVQRLTDNLLWKDQLQDLHKLMRNMKIGVVIGEDIYCKSKT